MKKIISYLSVDELLSLIKKIKTYIAYFLIAIVGFLSVLTYLKISKSNNPTGPDPESVMSLLLVNLIVILMLIFTLGRKYFSINSHELLNKKRSKLQIKIITRFSIVAIVPTIIITIFSSLFFNYGIQNWFNEKINTAFKESVEVAKAYINDHQSLIKTDADGIALNLTFLRENLHGGAAGFNDYLSTIAYQRSLLEACIFSVQPFQIVAQASFSLPFNLESLPKRALQKADDNIVVIREEDKVQALMRLEKFPGKTYLLISRIINPKVLSHEKKTKESYSEYIVLKENLANMQMKFLFIFIVVSLMILLAAIWAGIIFTSGIVEPILMLVDAIRKVKKGNYTTKLKESIADDEISTLIHAFNDMTSQLALQRKNLINANAEINTKRHFSETILANINAGVIALDTNKNITMINPKALFILNLKAEETVGNLLENCCAEFGVLISEIDSSDNATIEKQMSIMRKFKNITLFVRITNEIFDQKILGYIITFDDITKLAVAQRSAAWSDIARRIAHEIKNPLTPIHLAAQRLDKKFKDSISDSTTFSKYLDTIIRHVQQIARIIEEFIYFSRMPSPQFAKYDLSQIVRDVLFSREFLDNKIKYSINNAEKEVMLNCDHDQISQVLTNLVKNAEEAILLTDMSGKNANIAVTLLESNDNIEILIEDDGPGISVELFDRLTEPYVTNKPTGTGLGLAIVKKILDDHNAKINFVNMEEGGARVSIKFNKDVF